MSSSSPSSKRKGKERAPPAEPSYEDNYPSLSGKRQKSETAAAKPPEASPLVNLLGDTLTSKAGAVPTSDALKGKKYVGLYFSAHWCPPCQKFTPKLGAAYTEHLKNKGLEIIFISSDNSEAEFKGYYAKHAAWLALPYAARDIHKKLNKKFRVGGIPTFIILDGATGAIVAKDARTEVMQDPKGLRFPWRPKTFEEALGGEFLSGSDGDTVDADELKESASVLGLYFSAAWCPPCQAFTPKLADAYRSHLKGKGLEVLYVSADESQEQFAGYYKKMPWLAIPQGDARARDLEKLCKISSYPTLVLIDLATGAEITRSARSDVTRDPTGEGFPWPAAAAVDAEKDGSDDVNETPSLCLLLDSSERAGVGSAVEALERTAKAHRAAARAKGDEPCAFYYSSAKGGDFAQQVRGLCSLPPAPGKADVVLLDIPDDGGYYTPAGGRIERVSETALSAFLQDFLDEKLQRRQMGK